MKGESIMAKFNIYEEVTNRIIEQLESGVIPWHKPWHGVASGAYNRISNKPYSLLNQMLLKHDGEYATYKQWHDIGGKVKNGEKSEIVVFWKILDVEETKDGKTEKKSIPLLKYINVFHVSQVDGVEPKAKKLVEHNPVEEAENIKIGYADRENIVIKEIVTNEAFYSPMKDYIQVPCKEQYDDIMEFYSTLFHEMIHSTGHKDRLGRLDCGVKLAGFGSENYSKEELVAEIGSAFLMNHIGIESPKTFKNSAAYIQSWLKVLKDDNRFIVSASSKAEKAMKYILGDKKQTVVVE
jgi:antirestriction protein ArdC